MLNRCGCKLLARVAAALVPLLAAPCVADDQQREEQYLLELGVGIGGISAPHYPGADQSNHYLVPVPYVHYRSDRLRADRTGVTAVLAEGDDLELDLSARAGLPVDSDDNRVRRDMPDLGWLFELGPVLRYTPWKSAAGTELRVELPLRAVFSLEDSAFDHRGWTASPGIMVSGQVSDWSLTGSLLAYFGDREYHGYFYDVEPRYVTDQRPGYRAEPGYTGARLGLSANRKVGDWYMGTFVHHYALLGAENADSPLFREDGHFAAGFMISRLLYRSTDSQATPDDR